MTLMLKIFGKIVKGVIKILTLLLIFSFVVGYYAIKIEPYLVKTKDVIIQTKFYDKIKVVQISDIQISKNYTIDNFRKVIDTINEENPDIVLFTGDLYENYAEYHDDQNLIEALASIQSTYGKFAVWGNRDYGGGASRKYEKIMEQGGFQVLCNEYAVITFDMEEEILIAGLDDALLGNPDVQWMADPNLLKEKQFSILLTHEPDTADLYADMRFDLILSGHSYGGQVKIPFLPQIKTSMAEKYVDGMYHLNDKTDLYVNSGIGTSHYPIRFGVIPEVTVFYLEKEA